MEYDQYYQTDNLFGQAYPELLAFYCSQDKKGTLLDLGCGQGRDSIPLAKLGYHVTGIDNSQVGIDQMNEVSEGEALSLCGIVDDIYKYSNFDAFDHILLDSMFHFTKKDKVKEVEFLNRLFTECKPSTIVNICIQKTGKKVETLNSVVENRSDLVVLSQTELTYIYEDKEANHSSETQYIMLLLEKVENSDKS